jgi:hypothetical protein
MRQPAETAPPPAGDRGRAFKNTGSRRRGRRYSSRAGSRHAGPVPIRVALAEALALVGGELLARAIPPRLVSRAHERNEGDCGRLQTAEALLREALRLVAEDSQ